MITIDDFAGNDRAKQLVFRATEQQKISHAYLLYGEKGFGKRTFAHIFAQAILCTGVKKPCGGCKNCSKVKSGNHPDLHVLGSDGAKNSFHAEEVRAVRTDAYIRANDSDRKVYILQNIDAMSISAANALLKILEEPPKDVYFIMTAENRFSVPETVLSRCVPVALCPVSGDEALKALAFLLPDKPESERREAVKISGGNIGRAVDMLCGGKEQADGQFAREIAKAWSGNNTYDALVTLSQLEKDRMRARSVADKLTSILRDALEVKAGLHPKSEEARALAERFTVKRLYDGIERLGNTQKNLDRNANTLLTLTWLCAGI